jgi:hypothetical protein
MLGAIGSAARAIAALSPSASRLVLASTSTIATSTCSNCQHDRGKHDHVDGKNEHGRVPDMAQQAEPSRDPPQPDRDATSISDIGAM